MGSSVAVFDNAGSLAITLNAWDESVSDGSRSVVIYDDKTGETGVSLSVSDTANGLMVAETCATHLPTRSPIDQRGGGTRNSAQHLVQNGVLETFE